MSAMCTIVGKQWGDPITALITTRNWFKLACQWMVHCILVVAIVTTFKFTFPSPELNIE